MEAKFVCLSLVLFSFLFNEYCGKPQLTRNYKTNPISIEESKRNFKARRVPQWIKKDGRWIKNKNDKAKSPNYGTDETNFDIEPTTEWDRYIEYNKDYVEIKKPRQRPKKNKSENKIISPIFILSRTKDRLIVKQQERGSDSFGKGGFEFPKEQMVHNNVQYNYDGSISPLIKLIETNKGLVSKKLEYGKAKNSGLNWEDQDGSAIKKNSGRSSENINEKGEVNAGAGINIKFINGSISTEGMLQMNAESANNTWFFEPIEALPDDNAYSNEDSEYGSPDNVYEKVDEYYDEFIVPEGSEYPAESTKSIEEEIVRNAFMEPNEE